MDLILVALSKYWWYVLEKRFFSGKYQKAFLILFLGRWSGKACILVSNVWALLPRKDRKKSTAWSKKIVREMYPAGQTNGKRHLRVAPNQDEIDSS